jgi:hypothetical protein
MFQPGSSNLAEQSQLLPGARSKQPDRRYPGRACIDAIQGISGSDPPQSKDRHLRRYPACFGEYLEALPWVRLPIQTLFKYGRKESQGCAVIACAFDFRKRVAGYAEDQLGHASSHQRFRICNGRIWQPSRQMKAVAACLCRYRCRTVQKHLRMLFR